MLVINLKRVFKARGIPTPYKFLVGNGFNSHTAHRLLNQKSVAIKLVHLERICDLLKCNPNDLLEWLPSNLLEDTPNHPLQVIRKKDKNVEITRSLADIPLDRLVEVEQFIEELRKKDKRKPELA